MLWYSRSQRPNPVGFRALSATKGSRGELKMESKGRSRGRLETG